MRANGRPTSSDRKEGGPLIQRPGDMPGYCRTIVFTEQNGPDPKIPCTRDKLSPPTPFIPRWERHFCSANGSTWAHRLGRLSKASWALLGGLWKTFWVKKQTNMKTHRKTYRNASRESKRKTDRKKKEQRKQESKHADKREENQEKTGRQTGRQTRSCLLYTSPSPRDLSTSRMPSSA